MLRQVHKAQASEEEQIDPYLYNNLSSPLKQILLELLKEKDYELLYELLFNYCASRLDVFAKLKKMDMTGEDILAFITLNADAYQWYKSIDEFLV